MKGASRKAAALLAPVLAPFEATGDRRRDATSPNSAPPLEAEPAASAVAGNRRSRSGVAAALLNRRLDHAAVEFALEARPGRVALVQRRQLLTREPVLHAPVVRAGVARTDAGDAT